MTLITSHRRRSIAARIDDGETCELTRWQAVAFEWYLRACGWGEA